MRPVRGLVAGTAVLILFSSATAWAALTDLGTAGGVNYQRDTTNVPAPGNVNHDVFCPGSKWITGGGFGSASLGGQAFSLFPIDDGDVDTTANDGWHGVVGVPAGTQDLEIYAICSGGSFKYRRGAQVSRSTVGPKSATASCPGQGFHAVGGGGELSGTILDAYINSSYPTDSNDAGRTPDDGWKVRVQHTDAGGLDIRAWVICQSQMPSYPKDKRTIGPGISSAVTPGCTANSEHVLGVGGRLSGDASEALLRALRTADGGDADTVPDDGILSNGKNNSGAVKTLTGWAICD